MNGQCGTEMMNNLSVGLKHGTDYQQQGTRNGRAVGKTRELVVAVFFPFANSKKKTTNKLGACMHAYSGLNPLYMPCVWENNSYSPSQSGHCWTIASFVSQGIVHDKQLVSLINNY